MINILAAEYIQFEKLLLQRLKPTIKEKTTYSNHQMHRNPDVFEGSLEEKKI